MTSEIGDARKRAFAHKSKGGCRTCKLRRVKCDEGKPFCRRCLKSGRPCEGYFLERASSKQLQPINIQPKATLTTTTAGSLRDDYYLDFFSRETAPKIAGGYDQSFWTRVIVQIAHSEPAVRRAIQAVGAGHELIERNEGVPVTRLNENALRDYTHAVAYLRHSMTDRIYVNLAIIALFVCLEFIMGNEEQASIHIDGGLRMLSNWQSRTSPSTIPSTPESNSTLMSSSSSSTASEISLMDEMTNVFSRLQVQTSVFGRQSHEASPRKVMEDTISDHHFRTLDQVRDEGFQLLSEAMEFISQTAPLSYSEDGVDQATHYRQQGIVSRLSAWRRGYESFDKRLGTTLSPEQLRSGKMLAALVICAYIWSSTCVSPYEEAFDKHTADFQVVIDLADEIARCPKESGSNPFTHFQFDMGLIPALHLVGTRCRVAAIRLKTIEILARYHWREGLFDSWRSAQYIRISMHLEETAKQVLMGLDSRELDDYMPCEGARIHFATVDPSVWDDGTLSISFYFKRYGVFGEWYVEQAHLIAQPTSHDCGPAKMLSNGRTTTYTVPHTHIEAVSDSSNGAFQHHLVNITTTKNPRSTEDDEAAENNPK